MWLGRDFLVSSGTGFLHVQLFGLNKSHSSCSVLLQSTKSQAMSISHYFRHFFTFG
jgi:hypothetical protein